MEEVILKMILKVLDNAVINGIISENFLVLKN